jgi:hypothetical protein
MPERGKMTTIRFEEVAVRGVRRWTENGKRRQETKKFYQTLNPFNKGADGMTKTREQIWDEIVAERASWLKLTPLSDSAPPESYRPGECGS